MSDNFAAPASGTTFATKDLSGIHYPKQIRVGMDGKPLDGTKYETVAASATNQVLGASGAAGDLLVGVLIIPASLSPGAVSIVDGSTSITIFAGGASSVGSLHPFYVPFGARCVGSAWKMTTGANVSAIGFGDFA